MYKFLNLKKLGLSMRSEMFDYPVEIKKVDWPFSSDFNEDDVCQILEDFSGISKTQVRENKCEFFEITRTDIGLAHPAIVLFLPKGYYTIKSIVYSPSIVLSLQKPPINPANYHSMRIQNLVHSLGEHFPETYILQSLSEDFCVIFQKFLFHPICQFNSVEHINQLIEILHLASQAHILLDYNQNHWLISKLGFLYYVDTDYIGQVYVDYLKCLFDNLNQSMVFITPDNVKLLPQALEQHSKIGNVQSKYIQDFKKVLKKLLESWGDKDQLSADNKIRFEVLNDIANS